MGVTAASLIVKVSQEGVDETSKKLGGLGDHVKSTGGFFQDALKSAAGFGLAQVGISSVGDAFGFVKDQLGEMISAGLEANRMDDILAQGLRSTHDASGQTVQSLDQLSTKLMGMTGIDDDSVKSAEQMLLTFTGIGKDAFPAATQAAADMATRMNGGAIPSAQQMQDAALQLGKALNDPATGLTALQRVGVTFTAQQKEQITAMMKAGDTAGAQKVILGELNKEFGGSAEAAGKANGGIGILTAQLDNAKQSVGQALVPALTQLAQMALPVVTAAADKLSQGITYLTTHGNELKPVLTVLVPIIGVLLVAAFVAWAVSAGAAAVATIAATWPVLAIGAAIAGLAALVIYAYTHWGWFRAAVNAARDELGHIWSFVQGNVLPILGNLAGKVGEAKDKFGDFLGVLGHIKDAIGDLMGKIGDLIGKLGGLHLPNLGGLHLPGMAEGGTVVTGGFYRVGEEGEEIVYLPGGAEVTNADTTRRLMGRGGLLPLGGPGMPSVARAGAGSGGSGGSGGGLYIAPGTSLSIPVYVGSQQVATAILPDLVEALRHGAGLTI